MTGISRRLRRQDLAALRGQLADLGYGQAESETPELFSRRLYPVPDHLRALDPNVVLVVGPRGSGKSALFNAFFSDHQDIRKAIAAKTPSIQAQRLSTEWVAVYPASTAFPDSQALSRWASSDEAARKIWHAMLVRHLADRFNEGRKTELKSILEPMSVDLPAILKAYDDPEANPTAALDELEQKLRQEDRCIFVGYDELDTLGGYEWELMARMVRGLVAFWSDYSRRWQRIRAKIFLRSDLFRRHTGMGTADFAKLAANRAELAWSDVSLLGMLAKRIANTSAGLAAYCRKAGIRFEESHNTLGLIPTVREPDDVFPLLERLAGEFMGAGQKKGRVRNWILDHLRDGHGEISPRSLVRLIEQAARKEAANRSLRPPKLIHPTALRQALDDVSNDHVTQGISNEWPWLEGVKRRLQQDRLVPWMRREIVGLLDSNLDSSWGGLDRPSLRPPVDQPADFLDYLIEIGVFRQRSDDRIDVSDLYLSGLGLRRKGGVKRGPGQRAATRS